MDERRLKFVSQNAELPSIDENPVIDGCKFAHERTDIVEIDEEGVYAAAQYIHHKMSSESYSPQTWRTHPLHIIPDDRRPLHDAANVRVLDWLFLISSLNFSFWSEKEGSPARYGVEWQESWTSPKPRVYTGYWSLVAALNRALSEGVRITDPAFYASEGNCPDALIAHVFRRARQSKEDIPLSEDRVKIMRQNGKILCERFGGSFGGFIDAFQQRFSRQGTALDLVQMVIADFPSFRDEVVFEGRKVYIWKRAQILVAELWAAFFPDSTSSPALAESSTLPQQISTASTSTSPASSSAPTWTPSHPLFPGPRGAAIHALTMFADYRVPQILHHLRILRYSPSLTEKLSTHVYLESGSPEEVALRAASVLSVEMVRERIGRIIAEEKDRKGEIGGQSGMNGHCGDEVSSVLIDFYLWDLAKRVEGGTERVEGIETADMLPAHRTRSIWY
ncbi:hypothetical protein BD626DRAFT_401421 [Schizophyllum amplum]|uniref:Queuosine 5'-phosphate N-glycosylase/hydrolase n=1 Tax=Schizophyllum amplum TaxID=97359 RepID=A0A550CGG4_9AGAR|nr:hypothetical protein BD626DRAFT_401421 [Auriculariopsis ampla]